MTKTKLRRGFRKESEEYALEYRIELGLLEIDPLDPFSLANHLEIPVLGLSQHPDISNDIKSYFAKSGQSHFSATSLCDGHYREIIHNDYQHPNRQASNIMHEISHIILGHPPRPPLLEDSCRNFDPISEMEANQLAFTLLVPKKAALYAYERFKSLTDAAQFYGVSVGLLVSLR